MVRDKQGRKMSKQLGNSPDLLDLIDKYGADAVRFGIMISSPAGNDLLFDETEVLYKATRVSPQLFELRNIITVGYLIVKGASFRTESRGLHFNTDHLQKSILLQSIIL